MELNRPPLNPVSIALGLLGVEVVNAVEGSVVEEMTQLLIQWRTSPHPSEASLHTAISDFVRVAATLDILVSFVAMGESKDYPMVSISKLCAQVDEMVTVCREELARKKKMERMVDDCSALICCVLQLTSTHPSFPMSFSLSFLTHSLLTEDRLLLVVRFLRDEYTLLRKDDSRLCEVLILLLKDQRFTPSILATCLEITPSSVSMLKLHIVLSPSVFPSRPCSVRTSSTPPCFCLTSAIKS